MKKDSRLSSILHVLLHMAEADGPATSEALAAAMHTNPVVLRRLMSGLRYAGFVASEKGHGGGWVLSAPLDRITLRDVHDALGAPPLLSVGHRSENPQCLVEQAVNAALQDSYREAEELLLSRLGEVTLAQLSRDFHQRMQARGLSKKDLHHENHV